MFKKWIYIVLFIPGMAFSQGEVQLLPTELKKQTVITQPVTLYKGFLRAGLAYSYGFIDKIFDEDGNRVSLSNSFGDSWTALATFQYGVTDRLQVGLDVPYIDQTVTLSIIQEAPGFDIFEEVRFEQSGNGIGDISLSGIYQIITETETRPAFTGAVVLTLPSGEKNVKPINGDQAELPVGSGRFSSELRLNLRKARYPFLFSGFASYKYNFEGNKVIDPGEPAVDFQDGGLFSVSGLVGYHVNEWMAIINDINYSSIGKNEVAGITTDSDSKFSLDYSPRLSFQIQRLRVNQVLRFPIVGRLSSADPGITVIVQYVF